MINDKNKFFVVSKKVRSPAISKNIKETYKSANKDLKTFFSEKCVPQSILATV